MRTVARRLAPVRVPYAFLGGAIVPLLLDNPRLIEFRPTKDVDALVQILTKGAYYKLEEKLTQAGFCSLAAESGPICRWQVNECVVDLMPTTTDVLGLSARWFPEALERAILRDLGDGVAALVVTVAAFLATKLDAFQDRGDDDYYASHDLEDVIVVIDGCSRVAEEVAAASDPMRRYIADSMVAFLSNERFRDALPGHFPNDAVAAGRRRIVLNRMAVLSRL